MQRLWYYTVGGTEQRGPIEEEQLLALVRSGEVAPTDLVWSEGMSDWTAVSTRPEFRMPEAQKTPEPVALVRSAPAKESAATPPDFGPWLSIVGVAHILVGGLLSMTCIGIPLGILMIFAGAAALGAKAPLRRTATVPADVALALAKFRTFFVITGVILLLNIAGVLFLLINMSGLAITLSRMAESFQ
jgi:hypothetical protein